MPKKTKVSFATNPPVMPALKRAIAPAPGAKLPPAFTRAAIDRSANKYKKRGK